ncbi:hypothetical protein ACTFIU_001534 [Dictyostelium citrinum]
MVRYYFPHLVTQSNILFGKSWFNKYSGDQTDDPSTAKDIDSNQPPQSLLVPLKKLSKPETTNCEQTMPIISLVHCYQLGNHETTNTATVTIATTASNSNNN